MKLIILLICTFNIFAKESKVIKPVRYEAPKNRYMNSTFSLIFGYMALENAEMIHRRRSMHGERDMANILTGIGVIRLTDSIFNFFTTTDLEKAYETYRENKDEKVFYARARELETLGFMRRMIRSSLVTMTGLIHLNLYQRDNERYGDFLDSGAFLILVGAFKFYMLSPEEKLNKRINKLDIDLSFYQYQDKVVPGLGLYYTF